MLSQAHRLQVIQNLIKKIIVTVHWEICEKDARGISINKESSWRTDLLTHSVVQDIL
jgi:hypothetical protein